jgi:translation elongation factor EF-4
MVPLLRKRGRIRSRRRHPQASGEAEEGKKRMRQFGKVDIPQEAFIQALKMGD